MQLGEWEATAVTLSFETTALEPSAGLREKILTAVRSDSAYTSPATATPRKPANVLPIGLPRRTWSNAQTSLAIAASLVLVALGAMLFVLWRQNSEAKRELAQLSVQMRDAQQKLARQHEAMGIVAAPGTRMSELAGTAEMPGAHAMIAYDKSGRAFLMAKGLPPAPAGKAYQLWFIKEGKKMPGRVFATDASGQGMLNDQIPPEALSAAVFAITMEPESGVPSPTGKVYLISGS